MVNPTQRRPDLLKSTDDALLRDLLGFRRMLKTLERARLIAGNVDFFKHSSLRALVSDAKSIEGAGQSVISRPASFLRVAS